MRKITKNLTKRITADQIERLKIVFQKAIWSQKYGPAISKYEKIAEKYTLSPKCKARLASLYYHRAISGVSKKRDLNNAERLYKEVAEKNPDPTVLRGLAVVLEMKGDFSAAEKMYKRAFRSLRTVPESLRGALGVGSFFEAQKKFKEAERWFKKEFSFLKRKDFGSAANLFLFYDRIDNARMAKKMSGVVSKLMLEEFSKDHYAGLDMSRNPFFTDMKKKLEKYLH